MNAGIIASVEGKLQSATVELSSPQLDGQTLRYTFKIIEGSLPQTGGETSIFVDDIHWNPYPF